MTPEEFEARLEADYNSLTGKFKHYCWEWDGLPIDEFCYEFQCCNCYAESVAKEAEELKIRFLTLTAGGLF